VLRLRQALYRLRQAPRAWNTKLDASLVSLSFTKCAIEHALYAQRSQGGLVIVRVYVDDLIVTEEREEDTEEFKREMKRLFRMSDLGLLTYYLGIEVELSKGATTLHQSSYAKKLLERSGLSSCKPFQMPMEEKLKLSKESTTAKVHVMQYYSIIDGVRYLTYSQSDIRFAVGYLDRFMEDPREDHSTAIKKLLRYVAGTIAYSIIYPWRKEGRLELIRFGNSDMTGDVDERKSLTGVLLILDGCPISWQSQKQRVVVLSTCEAEHIVAATACCQGVGLGKLLQELTGEALHSYPHGGQQVRHSFDKEPYPPRQKQAQ